MTKSNIILGVSTLVLAIGGAFTTKGSNKLSTNGKIKSGVLCVAFTSPCTSATGTHTNFTTNTSGRCTQGNVVFTKTTSNCTVPLRINPNIKL